MKTLRYPKRSRSSLRLQAFDSPALTHETDRQEKRDGYVYITGVEASKKPGDAHLTIAPKTGDVMVREFTVLGLQLQPDYDGDGTISAGDLEKQKNGEEWKIHAGPNLLHTIVFRSDVLLPFGLVKVSLEGTPEGCRLMDSKGNPVCMPRRSWTDALSVWRNGSPSTEKKICLECQTPGSGEIVFEFMAVEGGKSYRCEKRQRFNAQ